MHTSDPMRFFSASVLMLLGGLVLWLRPNITSMYGRVAFRHLRIDEKLHERIRAAVQRRADFDRSSPVLSWLVALTPLATAIALFAGIVPLIWGITAFAAITGLLFAFAFIQLLGKRAPRAALLQRRPWLGGVPWWMFAVGLACSLSPWLFFAHGPGLTAIVFAASWSLLFAAFGLSQGPSMVTTQDVSVERFVDDRVRMYRVAILLSYSALPPWFLNCFTVAFYRLNGWQHRAHVIVYFVTLAGWVIPWIWEMMVLRRAPESQKYPELAAGTA